MHIKVLGSNSHGNCFLLDAGSEVLLLECGLKFKNIQQGLSFDFSRVTGCLITHEHKDHSNAVLEVMRAGINVYCSSDTAEALSLSGHRLRIVKAVEQFDVGDLVVMPFETQHDVAEPEGFLIYHPGTGEKLLYASKRNPAISNQNPTARRARIAAGMAQEAEAIERIQVKLYAIADVIRETTPGADIDVIEINSTLRDILKEKGYNIVGEDFLGLRDGGYDRILMNPPFEKGQDIEHVRHAYSLLKPGGKVVAIMSEGSFFRSDKKADGFREWLSENDGSSDKLPDKSFAGKDSERQTGAATRIVVIEKPAIYNDANGDAAFFRGKKGESEGRDKLNVDTDRGRDKDSVSATETERTVRRGTDDVIAERRISDLAQTLGRKPEGDHRPDELRASKPEEYEWDGTREAIRIAEAYGAQVTLFYYETAMPTDIEGTLLGNVIYANTGSGSPVHDTIAHELIHYFKRQRPEVYKKIMESAGKYITAKKFAEYKPEYRAWGYKEKYIIEELFCDIGRKYS